MRRERGIALLLVMWLTMLLAAVVGTFALTAQMEKLQGRTLSRGVVAEQVHPRETRSLEKIELGHDEAVDGLRAFARQLAPADRAFGYGDRDLGLAFGAEFRRGFPRRRNAPVEINILFQRAVDQARRPEIQHDAVGLDDAGVFLGIDGAQAAPDHLDHGGLVGTGPQQHDAGQW